MLDGIKIKPLKKHFDERGSFTELMRDDWKNILELDKLVQANISISYPGMIRAWHQHQRGQIDYFICIKGTVKICVFDDETMELDEIISTGEEPKIVRVPGKYWHGFKVVGDNPAWLIYFVNKLYDHSDPDEKRRPWNDKSIIPKLINGRINDKRTKKPWDWLAIPYK